MIMKYLIFNCLILLVFNSDIQGKEEKRILEFAASCKNMKISLTSIKEDYLCKINNKAKGKDKRDVEKFLDEIINHFRKELQYKDLSNLHIINVANDPEVQNEFLSEDLSHYFVLKYENKVVQYFLMENNEIKSLIVLDKGGIKNFIILCN